MGTVLWKIFGFLKDNVFWFRSFWWGNRRLTTRTIVIGVLFKIVTRIGIVEGSSDVALELVRWILRISQKIYLIVAFWIQEHELAGVIIVVISFWHFNAGWESRSKYKFNFETATVIFLLEIIFSLVMTCEVLHIRCCCMFVSSPNRLIINVFFFLHWHLWHYFLIFWWWK